MIEYNPDLMPDDITPEKKLMKNIYAFDFFALVASFALAEATKNYVASPLQLIYVIGIVISGLILTRQSTLNPRKRVWQSIQLFVMRPTETYQSISLEEPEIQENLEDGIFD